MINEYITYLLLTKGFSANTSKAYENALRLFAQNMATKQKRWSTISSTDIVSYLQMQKQSKSASTISLYISAIRGIYHYICHRYNITDPTKYIVRPKNKKYIPHIVNTEDIRQAIIHEKDQQTKLAIMLIAETGLRTSEARSLRYEDIDKQTGRTLIVGKGNKERYIYISKKLLNHLNKKEGKVFSYEDRDFRYRIYQAFARIGVKCSPHILRHTFASNAINKGMRIDVLMEILGHTSIETTQIYLHTSQDIVQNEMLKYCA